MDAPRQRFDTGLDDAQRERLACLAEEAGEIVQAVGKILRHGFDSAYDNGLSNTEILEKEIGDLRYVVERLVLAGDIDPDAVRRASREKIARFRKFTHFQPDSEDWRNGDPR